MEAGTLRTWYEGLTAASVRKMKGVQQENRLLDFKLLSSDGFTDRTDKQSLAVALSGFSNSEGGVVIWGVDARKDSSLNGIDVVTAVPGVRQSRLALSRLTELTSQACSPAPFGVDHRELVGRGGPSFVATYVPASERPPLMAKAGIDRYYFRSAGSFMPMEHFQIADMFGRRARPELELSATAEWDHGSVRLELRNVGRGPARAPFVAVWPGPPFHRNLYGVDGNRREYMEVRNATGGWVQYLSGADFVLHPTMSVQLGGVWLGHGFSGPKPSACQIKFKLGAMDIQPMEGEIVVPMPWAT